MSDITDLKCITSIHWVYIHNVAESDPLGHHQLLYCKFKHVVTLFTKRYTHTHVHHLICLLNYFYFQFSFLTLPLLSLPYSIYPPLPLSLTLNWTRGRGQQLLGYWVHRVDLLLTLCLVLLALEASLYSLSSGSCRILACVPSNSASDLIVRREGGREKERWKAW